jgi:hypothetical protein
MLKSLVILNLRLKHIFIGIYFIKKNKSIRLLFMVADALKGVATQIKPAFVGLSELYCNINSGLAELTNHKVHKVHKERGLRGLCFVY